MLQNAGLRPAKRWGQNFLCDENILHKILDAAEIKTTDYVLEIGGGLGTLTQALAQYSSQVVVVEVDPKLVPLLSENLNSYQNIEIIESDILDLDWQGFFSDKANFKSLGNLPYNITSLLLERLVQNRERIECATWMMQLEVAQKITAEPGTRQSSSLGVFVQSYCDVNLEFRVSKNAYYPRPEVDSAVLNIKPLRKPRFDSNPEIFNRVVRAAYGMRRKTLLKALSLSPQIDLPREKIESILQSAEIDPKVRGENLTIPEFDRIALRFEAR